MRHIVMFSGGGASWATARRVIERGYVPTLLFADTLIEDEDLYRFLDDAAEDLGVEITRVADGRDPWQVFFERRFLGNTRVDLCSRMANEQLDCFGGSDCSDCSCFSPEGVA